MGKTKDKDKKVADLADALATRNQEEFELQNEEAFKDLTERRKLIARLKLRGLSQTAIAKFLNVSQPYISAELRKIREHFRSKGATLDQDVIVGETTTVYEEVEHKAWELFQTAQSNSDKNKALNLVMTAREKQIKLLMDLGRIEKSDQTTKVSVDMSPLIKQWDEHKKQQAVEAIVGTVLTELPPPEPPSEEDIEDAYIIEDDDE